MTENYLPSGEESKGFLFTKAMVKEIVTYEKTVELIGIVDDVDFRPKLLKFTLKNDGDDIIQVLIWSEKIINDFKCHIMSGNILHIDSAYARLRNEKMSNGNTMHDLTIMSNTVVALLKSTPLYNSTQVETIHQSVAIEDCIKYEGTVGITGYIKNIIKETSLPNAKINQGCITDCIYKLEIRMPNVCDMSEFPLGSHVKVIGTIKYSLYPYLWVLKKSDVSKESNEIKKITDLLKGTRIPKRQLN